MAPPLSSIPPVASADRRATIGPWAYLAPLAPQVAALYVMFSTENDVISQTAFLLTWATLNFAWIVLLRRPALAGALSLAMIVVLVLLSRLKYDVMQMTANFVDLMVIDRDTATFFFTIFPDSRWPTIVAVILGVGTAVALWQFDRVRLRRLPAAAFGLATFSALVTLSAFWPNEAWQGFYNDGYVSKFSRSGINAIYDFVNYGFMESDTAVADHLKIPMEDSCHPAARRPHIIMIHDESSFDIRSAPGIKVPANYGEHFRSYDGKARKFLVEGNGGPSWFTEYNVLAGLSSRSFGKFSYFVTRIASGRVERGLPLALRRCGYSTVSLYPAYGAFMSARNFQTTTGVQRFLDAKSLGAQGIEPDRFFYDHAVKQLALEKGPVFMFVYLAANHFPWTARYRPDLMPEWRDPGNLPNVDEYLRRQAMSVRDYTQFIAQLKKTYPNEPFLIVRFGDHQPEFSPQILEPGLDEDGVARRLMAYDLRYFSTYYAIDAINFKPLRGETAMDTIDAAYLPIVIQDLAGIPLDPTFEEQKKVMLRCGGLFYACKEGAEASRFNRMLIDAGFIKGL